MKTEKILLTDTILAAVALTQHRFTNFAGGVPTAGQATLGINNANYDAGELAGVNTHGLLTVEAGGAITAGASVQTDASGRAITFASGEKSGVARDAAAAAGDFIRVLR